MKSTLALAFRLNPNIFPKQPSHCRKQLLNPKNLRAQPNCLDLMWLHFQGRVLISFSVI